MGRQGICRGQCLPLRLECLLLALIDQFGPLADGAVGIKTTAHMQYRCLLRQGIGLGVVRLGAVI